MGAEVIVDLMKGLADRARHQGEPVVGPLKLERECRRLRYEQIDAREGGGFQHEADRHRGIALLDELQRAPGDADAGCKIVFGHAATFPGEPDLLAEEQ